jgi:crotonobetainyl-CoA:carnitine CoA-transferase CaiB-like acyl-CoA transferase
LNRATPSRSCDAKRREVRGNAQHNHEILAGLGLSEAEIAALEADDQVGTPPIF